MKPIKRSRDSPDLDELNDEPKISHQARTPINQAQGDKTKLSAIKSKPKASNGRTKATNEMYKIPGDFIGASPDTLSPEFRLAH